MPNENKKSKTTRLNLDISAEARGEIVETQRRLGAATMTEAIRRGFPILNILLECRDKGGKIVLHHAAGDQETLNIR